MSNIKPRTVCKNGFRDRPEGDRPDPPKAGRSNVKKVERVVKELKTDKDFKEAGYIRDERNHGFFRQDVFEIEGGKRVGTLKLFIPLI